MVRAGAERAPVESSPQLGPERAVKFGMWSGVMYNGTMLSNGRASGRMWEPAGLRLCRTWI